MVLIVLVNSVHIIYNLLISLCWFSLHCMYLEESICIKSKFGGSFEVSHDADRVRLLQDFFLVQLKNCQCEAKQNLGALQ